MCSTSCRESSAIEVAQPVFVGEAKVVTICQRIVMCLQLVGLVLRQGTGFSFASRSAMHDITFRGMSKPKYRLRKHRTEIRMHA